MQYKGGVLSATALVTSSSSASGMWTMRQHLQAVSGTGWPAYVVPAATAIGQPYGGGFIGGKINVSGTIYYLIIGTAVKAGFWGPESSTGGGTLAGTSSLIDGPTNSATLKAMGGAFGFTHEAAIYCEDLTTGGYTDWYLPALNELEVIYYNLKPTTTANYTATSSGSNSNAVSPEPANTNYTSGLPAQTNIASFRSGGLNKIPNGNVWTSTEFAAGTAYIQNFDNGAQSTISKDTGVSIWTLPVRRVAV